MTAARRAFAALAPALSFAPLPAPAEDPAPPRLAEAAGTPEEGR